LSVQKAVADTEPDIDEPVVPEAVSHAVAPPGAQGSGRTKVLTNQPPPKPVAAKPPQVLAKPNTKSHWYVQLGAFSNMDNAHLQLDKWKARKYQGILSPLDARKGPLYRVLIGPYTTKDQAADAQKQMIQAGELRTALIEE
jgi:cell division septation protein DedD